MKKLLSVLLVMMMTLALLPTIGSAASYTVSGDSVIYKTPQGTTSLVEYTLMDGTTKVTDGVTWSLAGTYTGVSIDNAGKLKVTNAASGTFSVVATTAGGSASKEVTIDDNFLFEDFESKTAGSINADSVYEKGGAFYGPQSSIVEESGNKYVRNFNNLSYTTGVNYNSSNCVVGAFYNNANYANSFTEMHTNAPKVITLEGKFRNSNIYAWDTPQWMFSLVFNSAKTGKPLYGYLSNNATQRETLRIISIKTNQQNQAYTISSNHNSTGAYTATTVDVPNVGSHASTLTGNRDWITARVTIDFEKYTYTVWAEDRIIYENYPLPEHATEGKVSSLSAWGLTCAADDLAVYSGYKNEMKDYDVAGDSTIYKTPQGTEAFVEYKLMDGAARITDGITWSLEGNPVGVSIDNAGKLKVTNAASGTFTVVGTTAKGIGKKEVTISNYLLFEDFESKEAGSISSAPVYEKGGAFYAAQSSIVEESGNKYVKNFNNLSYTTGVNYDLSNCVVGAFYNNANYANSFTEMHTNAPKVITLEGKFKNTNPYTWGEPQWMFSLVFNSAKTGKPLYGYLSNNAAQRETLRIISIKTNELNQAYTISSNHNSTGAYTATTVDAHNYGTHSTLLNGGFRNWITARVTIDFEKYTYTVWAEDRIIYKDYPLPEHATEGKVSSLAAWGLTCAADDLAVYSGYKNAADVPADSITKGSNGTFTLKGIVKDNQTFKIAKYEGGTLVELLDAKDVNAIGKHTGTEVTIPNYDSKYTYKVFWWMPKLVPLVENLEFSAQ